MKDMVHSYLSPLCLMSFPDRWAAPEKARVGVGLTWLRDAEVEVVVEVGIDCKVTRQAGISGFFPPSPFSIILRA